MAPLRLGSHREVSVTVDHCAPCRLVWFDRFESVHLNADGWVRLLRTLQADAAQHAALSVAQAAAPRLDCPACRQPLARVVNSTRFGRFSAHECKSGHGHLQGHVSLLAERGLLRPLGAAERRALAQESRALNCLNCGGAAHALDDRCRWCDTALMVVDLPRLLHSLRPRDEAAQAAPVSSGRPLAWHCRGCGTALDPGREPECRACGHLVVAQGLPDLEPFLAAAEAALQPIEDARRNRQERSRQARTDRASPSRSSMSPAWQVLLLRGWLPMIALALLAAAALWSLATGGLGTQPSPLAVLRAQPLDPDLRTAWSWARELRRLSPDPRVTRPFERRLLQFHLSQLGGQAPPPGLTLGDVMEGPPRTVRDPGDSMLAGIAAGTMQRALEPVPGEAGSPPAEALGRERWSLAAPGVWIEADRRASALWMPTFRNRSSLPFPLPSMVLRSGPPVGDNVTWRCRPATAADPSAARGAQLIGPGQSMTLLCRTAYAPSFVPAAWQDFTSALRQGDTLPLRWEFADPSARGLFDPVLDAVVGLAAAAPPAQLSWRERWRLAPTGPRALAVGALAVLAWAATGVLIRTFGRRLAFVAGLLAAVPAAVAFGGGLGAASVLTVGGAMAAAVLASLGLGLAWGAYEEMVLRPLGSPPGRHG